ncbi:MAG: hypothetical protein M1821_000200 [Bathelium mastoideum]|nr:MAG: hypothetical protein M1821_000200 [Bathelium mastoideum]
MKAPENYYTLPEAYKTSGKPINVMGVVIDHLPPMQTRGDDLLCTFNIQDPDFSAGFSGLDGLRVRYFGRGGDLVPKIQSLGDVVVLRNVMMKDYRSESVVLSNKSSSCVVFHHRNVPDSADQITPSGSAWLPYTGTRWASPPSNSEQTYAVQLKEAMKSNILARDAAAQRLTGQQAPIFSIGNSNSTLSRRDKFSLIKNIKAQMFHDLVGQVVKVFPSNSGDVDLYITDYTSNSLLMHYASPDKKPDLESHGRYGDEYGYISRQQQKWHGPYGNLILKIGLKQPNASYVQYQVQTNDFVAIQNVRIKTDSHGNLEGDIFPDNLAPNRVNIEKIKGNHNEKVRDIKLRKEQYDHTLSAISEPEVPEKKASKKLKKKQQKKERKEAEAAMRSHSDSLSVIIGGRNEENRNVRCSNGSVNLSTIDEIISGSFLYDKTSSGIEYRLPFINAKYRSQIRVVDFHPHDLKDFTRTPDNLVYNDVEQSEGKDADPPEEGMETKKWEWAFVLLVEDGKQTRIAYPKAQLKLLVAGSDADYLLKLDATDLRKDETAFRKLQEKLFLLWGDLEEVKAKTLLPVAADSAPTEHQASGFSCSSKPFDCCIMEYGVPVESRGVNGKDADREWVRMHKMFETTIMSG